MEEKKQPQPVTAMFSTDQSNLINEQNIVTNYFQIRQVFL